MFASPEAVVDEPDGVVGVVHVWEDTAEENSSLKGVGLKCEGHCLVIVTLKATVGGDHSRGLG